MKRRLTILVVLVLAIMLGALREFLFINLNYSIDHLVNHRAYSYAHSTFSAAVEGFGLRELHLLKWTLAVSFIGVMFGLTVIFSRTLFGDHRYRKPLAAVVLAIGGLALLMHWGSAVHPALGAVSVKLLHLLQYPVVLLFLLAASMLRKSPAQQERGG